MEKQDWNKFFLWLAALFPQWKVDSGVSAVWFEQLGRFEVEDLKNAVTFLRSKDPSPFPPGVFEITSAVDCDSSTPELDAARAWKSARLCARGSMTVARASETDTKLAEAIQLIGGIDEIGMCPQEKRPFLERRFLEIYRNLSAEKTKHKILSLQKYTGPERIGNILPKLAEKAGKNEG